VCRVCVVYAHRFFVFSLSHSQLPSFSQHLFRTTCFKMMFNKIAAAVTALVGVSSMLIGVAALPTGASNITEIVTRSIDPAGTHTGQVCS
jgi:hypothetical protein